MPPKNLLPLIAPPASICILRLSAIGDCTHVVPIVRTIQRHWPETRITWIIGKAEAALFSDIAGVEFIVFDKRQGWQALFTLRRTLQARRFDVLLDLQVSLRASIVSLLIHAPIKLGYDRARAKNGQWMFTNCRIAAVETQHVLDSFFEFTKTLGLPPRCLAWDIPIPKHAQAAIAEHIKENQPILVINPCSSGRFRNWRNWSAERYAEVADYAVKHKGMQVVLTGGPTESERAMSVAIQQCAHVPLIDLVGKTDLKRLLALIARATVVLAPDTGPAHIATAAGTPVIGLYATSNPKRTGPYLSLQHTVNLYPEALQAETGLSVEQANWGQRVRNPDAMNRISVTAVIDKLEYVLAQKS